MRRRSISRGRLVARFSSFTSGPSRSRTSRMRLSSSGTWSSSMEIGSTPEASSEKFRLRSASSSDSARISASISSSRPSAASEPRAFWRASRSASICRRAVSTPDRWVSRALGGRGREGCAAEAAVGSPSLAESASGCAEPGPAEKERRSADRSASRGASGLRAEGLAITSIRVALRVPFHHRFIVPTQ